MRVKRSGHRAVMPLAEAACGLGRGCLVQQRDSTRMSDATRRQARGSADMKQRVSVTSQQTGDIRRTAIVTETSSGTGQATARACAIPVLSSRKDGEKLLSRCCHHRKSAPANVIVSYSGAPDRGNSARWCAEKSNIEDWRTKSCNGGESGIRTHGTVSRTHAFQACALSHSAISPERTLLKGRR